MKEIIREYGMTIIAVFSACMVLGIIFFGASLSSKLRNSTYTLAGDVAMTKSDKARELRSKSVPAIAIAAVPQAGQKYNAKQLFVNAAGSKAFASVRLMELWNSDTESGEYVDCSKDGIDSQGNICCKAAGFYKAKVAVVDLDGLSNTQWIDFIVEV